MSFSFNLPSHRPMIQESQSMKNNGGGGNAGYLYQERKKKEKKTIDVFSDGQDECDEFIPTSTIPVSPKGKILDRIIEKTKDFVNNPSKPQEEIQNTNNPFAQFVDYD